MIKMVASDLDGTLLLNKAQELPKELFPLIRQLTEMGILFVAASGRQLDNIQRLFGEVKDEIAYICENGAAVVYKGEVLYKDVFPKETADRIMRAVWEKEGTEMTVSGLHTYYLRPKTEEYFKLINDVIHGKCVRIDENYNLPEPCIKLAVYEQGGADEHLEFWKKLFEKDCKVVTSGNEWIDFIPFGTSKKKGVDTLRKVLGINEEECMAFGDEYNDLEMLESVTYSFAMETAKPGVKKTAKFTTPRVEPVLKELIKYHGNIEEMIKDGRI